MRFALNPLLSSLLVALPLGLASAAAQAQASPVPPQPASAATAARNAAVLGQLPFADRADYEAARRGLVARYPGPIQDADGKLVWEPGAYDFLRPERAADSVNPSLWRQAQLNAEAGLFKVADGIYQLRGLSLANMTLIEGDSGLIVVDPLTVAEAARAGLELYRQHRPAKPVVAVIYTHSHVDHFGGVRGVVDEADVKSGKVKLIAPAGFMEEAISENLYAGAAMFRRGMYQGGLSVPRTVLGTLDTGLGKSTGGGGSITLIAPNQLIEKTTETHVIDGVPIEFQLTPGTEAPAEMNFYLPRHKALCMAENVASTMHNILTPRGAPVRDAKGWSRYLDDSLVRYGDKTEVIFLSHHWPTWGAEAIRTVLADQRDMYAFLNDRTLHLANQGLTPLEIAQAATRLPGELDKKWYLRGYYGTLSFNVRAIYQRYLGFYDANPASLNPLPPEETARRTVAAMGGAEKVLALVREAAGKGDYRWAAQLGNHLVFADANDKAAREAQAQVLEQMGYQAESAIWRNIYVQGAHELRNGVSVGGGRQSNDLVAATSPAMFFDFMAIRLDADKAVGHDMTLNWEFADLKQSFALTLRNGVLTSRPGQHAKADLTVRMDKATLDRISLRQTDFPAAVQQGAVKLEGNGQRLSELMGLLTTFRPNFNVVAP